MKLYRPYCSTCGGELYPSDDYEDHNDDQPIPYYCELGHGSQSWSLNQLRAEGERLAAEEERAKNEHAEQQRLAGMLCIYWNISDSEVYQRLKDLGFTQPCPRCGGCGTQTCYEEGYGPIEDACYYCGMEGVIAVDLTLDLVNKIIATDQMVDELKAMDQ